MVFSSLSFLLVFLTLLLAVYFCVPRRLRSLRNLILLAASLGFYSCAGAAFLPVMLASIVLNYLGGLLCCGKRRKLWLSVTVVLNLAMLGYFKYTGFLASMLNGFGARIPIPEITLPIGISFFTFQGMSYVIDVYRHDVPVQRNPLKVGLYIALFPQLVAGPIVRYRTVAEEIDKRRETLDDAAEGIERFLLGLGKKMLLANTLASAADAAFTAVSPSAAFAWVGALAYTLQIYFDFSAYSDMAIGLGRIFGFRFPENFRDPYLADSVTDFWRRWHISLSEWFRDYLYIPLGGNRCSPVKHIRNLCIVWLLTGLWHGASWNFVLWGGWFFVLLVGEKYLWGKALSRLPGILQHLYALLAVILSWVLFRADDLPSAVRYLGAMLGVNGAAGSGQAVYYLLEYWPEWIAALVVISPALPALRRKLASGGPVSQALSIWLPKLLALLLLLLSYAKLVDGSFNPFIYFRF